MKSEPIAIDGGHSPLTAPAKYLFPILLCVALAGCATGSVQGRKGIEQKIAAARTAADHHALAASFEREADEAIEKAESHRGMGEHYVRWASILQPNYFGPSSDSGGLTGFWQQCEKLVVLYRQAAEESRSLAKLHRQLADAKP